MKLIWVILKPYCTVLDFLHKGNKMSLYSRFDKAIEDFDFARVEEVMKLLDWKWGLPDGTYRVPTQDEMKDTVRSLFQSAVDRMFDFNKTYTWCRTGGFCVSIFKDNTKDFNQHTIRISFEVESETIYPD